MASICTSDHVAIPDQRGQCERVLVRVLCVAKSPRCKNASARPELRERERSSDEDGDTVENKDWERTQQLRRSQKL